MQNIIIPFTKIMRAAVAVLMPAFFVLMTQLPVIASDLSDATTLREKCEAESKPLDIAVKNFGSQSDKSSFQSGADMLKAGKVKMAQSKFLEAKAIYNDYLKLQNSIYKSLAASYISRTDELINEITAELVDSIDNKKIDQYFKLAAQNLKDAKASEQGERYKSAVDLCRNAKKYVIDSYKLAGKKTPEKYERDLKDIAKQIYQEKK